MRILHISRTMGQGGAEKVVFQLCRDNYEAVQFVASCGGSYVEELKKMGVHHVLIPDLELKNPKSVIKTFYLLFKFVKDNNIDIIHSHHRMAAFYGHLLQIIYPSLKHLYTAHNVFWGKRLLMRFALRNSFIVSCGETVKDNLVKEYKQSENKIKIIYNTVDATIKEEISDTDNLDYLKKKGVHLIACIGRLTKEKRFDIFIKAINLCKKEKPNIVGVIIGDGEYRNEIEEQVNLLNLKGVIIFTGFREDVLNLISRMDFIVFPSEREGYPLTPIESFSMGKPVISSDIENNKEIVKYGVNGLTFKVNDYKDLSKKILMLLSNESLKVSLEQGALKTYKDKYNYSKFIKNYIDIYKFLSR